jgi:hypothetical protein
MAKGAYWAAWLMPIIEQQAITATISTANILPSSISCRRRVRGSDDPRGRGRLSGSSHCRRARDRQAVRSAFDRVTLPRCRFQPAAPAIWIADDPHHATRADTFLSSTSCSSRTSAISPSARKSSNLASWLARLSSEVDSIRQENIREPQEAHHGRHLRAMA